MPSIVHVIALLLGMVVGWLGMSAISSMFGNNKVQKESEAFSKNMLEELTKEITKEESNESKAKTGYEESKAQLDSDINALTTNTSKSE